MTGSILEDDPEAFEKGKRLLKKCFQKAKPQCLQAQRRFLARVQGPNENVYAFATELRALAREAYPDASETTSDDYVRWQFLVGINDERLKDRLLFCKPATMENWLAESEL